MEDGGVGCLGVWLASTCTLGAGTAYNGVRNDGGHFTQLLAGLPYDHRGDEYDAGGAVDAPSPEVAGGVGGPGAGAGFPASGQGVRFVAGLPDGRLDMSPDYVGVADRALGAQELWRGDADMLGAPSRMVAVVLSGANQTDAGTE